MRRAANVDRAHRAIVQVLRAKGALVVVLSQKDVPDLLVGAQGCWTLLEVKSEGEGKKGARWHRGVLSKGQAALISKALDMDLPAFVVRTPEEAEAAVWGDGTLAYALAHDAVREYEQAEGEREARAKKRAARPRKAYRPPTTERRTCALPTCGAARAKGSQWCVVHGEQIGIG